MEAGYRWWRHIRANNSFDSFFLVVGGGLGRDGGGISEPITARTIFGREGLGASDVGKNFKQKINKIIQVPKLLRLSTFGLTSKNSRSIFKFLNSRFNFVSMYT